MKSTNHCIDLGLGKHTIVRLPDAAGTRIVCHDGAAWVTLDDDERDYVLETGDQMTINEHRRALISALASTTVSVCAAPDPALREGHGKRANLAFEQVPT